MESPRIHVVPHSHWDREWYLPFAAFRRRLVDLLDSLLVALEREPGLSFHLDGQMAVVDDYLELRPEKLADLKRAARAGLISLGPWYTLPDEHLVSGECLLRNLELGQARARELGVEPMAVGYLPDQFGHTAQMPQLLRRRGIDVAVLWRGVPGAVRSAVFTWEALDGSSVDTVQLKRGYGHGRGLPLEAAALGERLRQEVDADREGNPDGPWLVMCGDDHQPVPSGLAAALPLAAGTGAAVSTLAGYVSARPVARDRWRGELRSADHSFVLQGTLSARFPLKLRHAALERRLERYLEPAWTLSGRPWPARELAYCWRQLILNSAHDSICGCSIDQVHLEASERLARGERLAGMLRRRLGQGELAFNPSPFERRGVPALSSGRAATVPITPVPVGRLGLELELIGDRGDEYTHQPPEGERPARFALEQRNQLGPDLVVEAAAEQAADEPFVRLSIGVDNRRRDHRLRLVVPVETSAGAAAGVAFGALERAYRVPGTQLGKEYDLPTDPARLWVFAGGAAVLLAGPFEYEL
ncbi:MAG TPA: hypothetical protein VK131_01615, partial [Candidatus Acidoferrales bacterium]|nr:hypothetical protein [Candidatus Acidoferrales bacterium]